MESWMGPSNDGGQPSRTSPYDPALVDDELRAFNASLTRAGQASRPSHARARAVRDSQYTLPLRGGGGAANSKIRTPTPAWKAHGIPAPSQYNSHGATSGNGMSKNTRNNDRYTSPTDRARARTGSVSAHLSPPTSFASAGVAPPSTSTPLRPFEDPNYYNPHRQVITTNWGEDQPGPFIPAHLKQTSANKTILNIHKETGIPMEELTSDGISIPAARPHAVSQQGPSTSVPNYPTNEIRQADMAATETSGYAYDLYNASGNADTMAIGFGEAASRDCGGDVVMYERVASPVIPTGPLLASGSKTVPRVANLGDSMWAPAVAPRSTVRSASTLAPTARPFVPRPTNHSTAPVQTQSTALKPVAPVQLTPYANPAVTTNTTREPGAKYLADSMWA